jgi:hypothetical protein
MEGDYKVPKSTTQKGIINHQFSDTMKIKSQV